jgi:hypothetical protein
MRGKQGFLLRAVVAGVSQMLRNPVAVGEESLQLAPENALQIQLHTLLFQRMVCNVRSQGLFFFQ